MLYNILMNNKIKQLLIAHINFAKGFRGGEMQTLLLIEYFSSRGYNQIVGIRDTNKLFLNRLQKIENLTIIKIKSPYVSNSNVPIVASRVGGIVDIIEDNFNGLLLDKIESNELKDKIMQLYHDKKTRDRLSNNAKLNVEKFSIENMGKEYEELLS